MNGHEIRDNRHLVAWRDFLDGCRQTASQANSLLPSGHLTRINGLVMEASGLKLPLGSSCRITPIGGSSIEAEVVGFHGERIFLMPSEVLAKYAVSLLDAKGQLLAGFILIGDMARLAELNAAFEGRAGKR